MPTPDLTRTVWVKSSYSGNNGTCVEVARGDAWVALRDSKNPHSGALVLTPQAFTAFLDTLKTGALDRR